MYYIKIKMNHKLLFFGDFIAISGDVELVSCTTNRLRSRFVVRKPLKIIDLEISKLQFQIPLHANPIGKADWLDASHKNLVR